MNGFADAWPRHLASVRFGWKADFGAIARREFFADRPSPPPCFAGLTSLDSTSSTLALRGWCSLLS